MLVRLVRPAFIEADAAIFLPFFSTRQLGMEFVPFRDNPDLELVDAPTSSLVIGQRTVSVALSGLEHNTIPAGVTHIEAVLDPVHDAGWTDVRSQAHVRVSIKDLIQQGTINPVNLVVRELKSVWLWRPLEQPTW